MRIVLFGGEGQLGRDLVRALAGPALLVPTHAEADVADAAAVGRLLDGFRPDCVVSAAAFHDVERCQEDPARALEVNAMGAWVLAREAVRVGARLVYVSTDYVFAGTAGRPYLETDAAEPVNAYGASKLAGEALARAADPRALVIRTAALYGPHPCRQKRGRNFVELMRELGRTRGSVRVVDDETVSPTWTPELAAAIAEAVAAGVAGTLHLAGAGQATWLELARAVFDEDGIDARAERAAPGEFPKKAPRPAFSALGTARAGEPGVRPMRPWREALRDHLRGRPGPA